MTCVDLNPDGPHSPDHTAELGNLFDDCSRAIVYATMQDKHGLEYPSEIYRLLGDLYTALSRFPQMCQQLATALHEQAATHTLYDARKGLDPAVQVDMARLDLDVASGAAGVLTDALRQVQADISGVGVVENE